jgi:flagellar hook-associated protein 3 FlgL
MTPVSTSNSYSVILNDLLSAQNREATAQAQVSTGKKGNDLSAFGSQTRTLVATNTVKARVDGLVTQLSSLQVKMNFQQASLEQISNVAANLKQSLTNALANGSGDGIMNDVQSFFSQAAQALNAQYGGDYLFSGGQTQTQPFTATDLPTLAAGTVASFFKDGNLTPSNRVDDATTIQTGFLASSIGQSLMTQFQSIQQFEAGATGSFGGALTAAQQAFLQTAITALDSVVTSTTATTAKGGDIQSRVETASTTQTDRQVTLKGLLGDITDVNMAQAASDLTQAQTAVQASAQVFMTLKGMSLLNFLSSGG